jgi:SAM-dependent methyltransferase
MEYLTFGPALHRRRGEFLNEIKRAQSVLILGDGDGRFTAEFLERNTVAAVDFVESSRAMAQLAAERIRHVAPDQVSHVRFIVEDARTARFAGRYDLVVTHFFLDCFSTDDLTQLIAKITAHVHPGGRWVISDFHIPHSGSFRYLAKLIIQLLYFGFRILTGLRVKQLPDYRAVLEGNGYLRTATRFGLRGMLVSEIWQLA